MYIVYWTYYLFIGYYVGQIIDPNENVKNLKLTDSILFVGTLEELLA